MELMDVKLFGFGGNKILSVRLQLYRYNGNQLLGIPRFNVMRSQDLHRTTTLPRRLREEIGVPGMLVVAVQNL